MGNETNWYSALTANEVVVGSKVIAGNSISEIEEKLNASLYNQTQITAIRGVEESSRFVCLDGNSYNLVYVIEMAQREGAWTDGNFPPELVGDFVKYKDGTTSKFVVTGWKVNSILEQVCVANTWIPYTELYNTYVRMDGSPCGYVAPLEDNISNVDVAVETDSIGANANDIQHTDGDAYN